MGIQEFVTRFVTDKAFRAQVENDLEGTLREGGFELSDTDKETLKLMMQKRSGMPEDLLVASCCC